MSIFEQVKEIILEKTNCKPEEITPESNLIDDLGLDSLDAVELIMSFEEKFEIEIPDEEAEKIKKVQDILSCIEAKKKD